MKAWDGLAMNSRSVIKGLGSGLHAFGSGQNA